jgi:hypothetical protein
LYVSRGDLAVLEQRKGCPAIARWNGMDGSRVEQAGRWDLRY